MFRYGYLWINPEIAESSESTESTESSESTKIPKVQKVQKEPFLPNSSRLFQYHQVSSSFWCFFFLNFSVSSRFFLFLTVSFCFPPFFKFILQI